MASALQICMSRSDNEDVNLNWQSKRYLSSQGTLPGQVRGDDTSDIYHIEYDSESFIIEAVDELTNPVQWPINCNESKSKIDVQGRSSIDALIIKNKDMFHHQTQMEAEACMTLNDLKQSTESSSKHSDLVENCEQDENIESPQTDDNNDDGHLEVRFLKDCQGHEGPIFHVRLRGVSYVVKIFKREGHVRRCIEEKWHERLDQAKALYTPETHDLQIWKKRIHANLYHFTHYLEDFEKGINVVEFRDRINQDQFIVMKDVGMDLHTWLFKKLDNKGKSSDLITLMMKVIDKVIKIHEFGVHNDLKMENILVNDNEDVYVIDFSGASEGRSCLPGIVTERYIPTSLCNDLLNLQSHRKGKSFIVDQTLDYMGLIAMTANFLAETWLEFVPVRRMTVVERGLGVNFLLECYADPKELEFYEVIPLLIDVYHGLSRRLHYGETDNWINNASVVKDVMQRSARIHLSKLAFDDARIECLLSSIDTADLPKFLKTILEGLKHR